MAELHWLTAAEAAPLIAARRLSPVELVDALLARIARCEPFFNAVVTLDAEGARAAARTAEQEIAAGQRRGGLHGIPVGIKDIIDVAGLPTTAHSQILIDNVASDDAPVVARLRRAGAIILAKTATHEFAIGGPSFDLPFPPARNPWNRDYFTGGSSSGSGAGVAAGYFPLALGTDTAGSIRNPAGACGIAGLKPSYGLVPRDGVFPLAFSLDHVGPLARSVADLALLLETMAEGVQVTDGLEDGVTGLRIGFVRHFHERDMPAEPAVAASLEAAAVVLQGEGARLTNATLPNLREFSAVTRILMQAEAWSVHAEWLRSRPQDYGQAARRRLLPGAFLTAGDYIDAQRRRRRLLAATEEALGEVDLLLCANSLDATCRIDDEPALQRSYPRQARTPFNVTGHPAVALPAGFAPNGLPVSLQLVARHGAEALLLQAARAFERATPWHDAHPATPSGSAPGDDPRR